MKTIFLYLHLPMPVMLALYLTACTPPSDTKPTDSKSIFDHPQSVEFVDSYLVVASTGYDPTEWRMGFISVIDPNTERLISVHKTSQLNPQRILTTDNHLYVINTGTYDFTDFGRPTSATPGGIDRIELNQLITTTDQLTPLPIDLRYVVAPIDGVILEDGRLAITSGLQPTVTFVGEKLESVLLPTNRSTGLGAVTQWQDWLVVVDFNSDRAFFMDQNGQIDCSVDLGEFAEEMEGASSPVIEGDTLYVIMALSGVVRAVDLDELSLCNEPARTVVSPLGQIPNDLHVQDREIWVVHSGDNNLTVYDLDTGQEIERFLMPVGSNPWKAAFSPNGRWIAVSQWANHAISLIDRHSGQIRVLTQLLE